MEELRWSTNRSLFCVFDEFTTMVSGAGGGAYSKNPSAGSNDRSLMLSLHSGARLSIGSLERGAASLPADSYGVCVLSGTQPSVAEQHLFSPDAVATGWLHRFTASAFEVGSHRRGREGRQHKST